jgi:hypothetical protein
MLASDLNDASHLLAAPRKDYGPRRMMMQRESVAFVREQLFVSGQYVAVSNDCAEFFKHFRLQWRRLSQCDTTQS